MELGHFDKQSSTKQEKRPRRGKNIQFFLLETPGNLRIAFLNEKFNLDMTTIGVFFPKIRAFFSNF